MGAGRRAHHEPLTVACRPSRADAVLHQIEITIANSHDVPASVLSRRVLTHRSAGRPPHVSSCALSVSARRRAMSRGIAASLCFRSVRSCAARVRDFAVRMPDGAARQRDRHGGVPATPRLYTAAKSAAPLRLWQALSSCPAIGFLLAEGTHNHAVFNRRTHMTPNARQSRPGNASARRLPAESGGRHMTAARPNSSSRCHFRCP